MPVGQTPGKARLARATKLFDAFVREPDPPGWTMEEIMVELDCARKLGYLAVKDLRLILAEVDDVNVIVGPQGNTWFYQMVGDFDDVKPFAKMRVNDLLARITSLHAVLKSTAAAYKGLRTKDARIVKSLLKGTGRALEDVADIKEEIEIS